MKKYELTTESKVYSGKKLFRIKALISFGDVKEGVLGGWVEKEENLSHSGEAWIFGDAMIYDDARVYDKAKVYGEAQVHRNAQVCDRVQVFGNASVSGKALIGGNARIYGDAQIYGCAKIYGEARFCGEAKISDDADYIVIGPMSAHTTFYHRADGETMVVCGCFHDTLSAFEKRVAKEHVIIDTVRLTRPRLNLYVK